MSWAGLANPTGTQYLRVHTNQTNTMATKLDKAIKRELTHGDKTYTITISPEGIKAVEKGKRNGREHTWASIIDGSSEAAATPAAE